ncbi:DUF167 domain-containing protein [Dehalogenimonas etheniformans]|uniref:UPF0235 protein JP09_007710 n=1 Tax=Dehalogenimonas etheniformans TaxID=1536648 RepID=A0A2P5P5Q6_9CHLR|nr:DUF167 domain-containing protein [Dehalogenimonas etheniformans]PPD57620.1 DUF167 domain-containing protein [Dehalogenimonas etheniformans]QNT75961.1 DUF167 domain-containing protein [Dehalogenimonas etheniformans]
MNRSLIDIHVQPGARKTEVVGLYGEAVKIKVAATPERGIANEALIDFIAERLGIAKNAVKLVRGRTGRHKTVAVEGMDESEARKRLLGAV